VAFVIDKKEEQGRQVQEFHCPIVLAVIGLMASRKRYRMKIGETILTIMRGSLPYKTSKVGSMEATTRSERRSDGFDLLVITGSASQRPLESMLAAIANCHYQPDKENDPCSLPAASQHMVRSSAIHGGNFLQVTREDATAFYHALKGVERELGTETGTIGDSKGIFVSLRYGAIEGIAHGRELSSLVTARDCFSSSPGSCVGWTRDATPFVYFCEETKPTGARMLNQRTLVEKTVSENRKHIRHDGFAAYQLSPLPERIAKTINQRQHRKRSKDVSEAAKAQRNQKRAKKFASRDTYLEDCFKAAQGSAEREPRLILKPNKKAREKKEEEEKEEAAKKRQEAKKALASLFEEDGEVLLPGDKKRKTS